MSKSKEKLEEISKEVTSLLKENGALISLLKSEGDPIPSFFYGFCNWAHKSENCYWDAYRLTLCNI